MTRSAAIAALTALATAIAIIAADLTPPASAQSNDETTGRIVARLLEDGRVEFGWQPTGGERVLPRQRYFPADATVDRWLRSSPVEVGGAEIGRINARLLSDGRIEFAFTPTDGERILTRSRYFPPNAGVGRWLRSTEIAFGPAAPRYIAISAAYGSHTCAISTSGDLACWGANEYGQSDTPTGSYTAVSTGSRHTCAIRESGELECWGYNGVGQVDAPEGSYSVVSAGANHTCAVRESGELECWGTNDGWRGYLGQSDPPPGTFTAVSTGLQHSCGLRTSGEIACWGSNEKYAGWNEETQEHEYADTNQATPPAGSFTAVGAGGWAHSCGLRESGQVACWGDNTSGQTNAPEGSFTAISTGTYHNCGLRENGAIECWGDNEQGQTDAPEGSFTAVSAAWRHTCGLRDTGAIECWGDNEYGQIDTPTESGQQPYAGPRYTAVSAGVDHTCAIRESGELECWGSNEGFDGYVGQSDPPPGTFIAVSAAVGSYISCGLRDTGEIECWGDVAAIEDNPPTGSYTALSAGWFNVCGLRENGAIDCTTDDTPAGRFSAVSTGGSGSGNPGWHTCAIRESDSAIECWGNNELFKITTINEETQAAEGEWVHTGQAAPPPGSFTAVSAGTYHTCAIRTGGAIECWGNNESGESDAPDGAYTAVSAGFESTCGLRGDGAITCWGRAYYSSKPVGRYTAVSVGGGHACAIRDTGAIRCWGNNNDGQTDVPTN